MTQDTTSTKVAVLTGLTMLVGGAEISTADAATTTQQENFFLNGNDVRPFNQFSSALGNLTGVTWNLTSQIIISGEPSFTDIQATVNVNFTTLFGPQLFTGPFNGTANPPIVPNDPFYVGPGVFPAALNFFADLGECSPCSATWNGSLSLTYTYDPATQNAVPLPAALPLFATGMGALGLVGLHRRRKQKIKEQA